MIEKLFGSNARVKILKTFLLHPEKKYYIRQLTRDLKLQVNSVRRELENLEEFGLLVSRLGTTDIEDNKDQDDDFNDLVKGKIVDSTKSSKNKSGSVNKQEKKYYQVNENFVLFEEIKALIVKAQILYEKDFIRKLEKIGRTKLLILTGLFVNNPNSSTDLLVVGRINKNKFLKLLRELEKELGKELNFTLMDVKEFKYRKNITDIFLYDILEGKNIVVIDEVGVS